VTTPTKKSPTAVSAPRRAVSDNDTRDRLGEICQRGEIFEALDRRGNLLGSFSSADAAIEAVRKALNGGA
jgi:hypothetical protein